MSTIIDILLPRHCLLCGMTSGRGNLCTACQRELPACHPALASAGRECPKVSSALQYQSPVDNLVCKFKFGGNLASGQVLADLLLSHIINTLTRLPDALVPVPLHGYRHFHRSFNQADIIARRVGRALGIPVYSRWLVRCRHTPAQSQLDAAARHQNINGAFRLKRTAPGIIKPDIALIDDVMTTGATLNECAAVLRAGGAQRVTAWTVARANPP